MPKEIAHFVMARKAGQAIPESSLFYNAVGSFPRLFTFGAVTPDINFYCLSGADKKEVQALSDPFHRPGASALEPVLSLLECLRGTQNQSERLGYGGIPLPALALSAGVVCHIMADTAFHPLVHYYAGMDGIHAGAPGRHRQFETAMDLYFWHLDPACPTRLNGLLASLEIPRRELITWLNTLFRTEPLNPRSVHRALRWHRGLQYLFLAPWMRRILSGLKHLGRPLPKAFSGLAYPFDHPVDLPFFTDRIGFYDPCTREPHEATSSELAANAVAGTLKILELIHWTIREGLPLAAILEYPDLPVIRPGLPKETFSLWLETDDIIPRIYRGYAPPF